MTKSLNKKMSQLAIFSIIFLLTTPLFAGGHEVNNGGGLAEKNIFFAYGQLNDFLLPCLYAPSCGLTIKEKKLLGKIKNNLSEEYANPNQIQFISSKNDQNQFRIDGQTRIARTGSVVGSPIQFNKELLYNENHLGSSQAITIVDSVAHLVHEMAHHHVDTELDQWSHEQLDLLGAKVALFLKKYIHHVPLLPQTDKVKVIVINGLKKTSFPTVLIYAFDSVFDVSPIIKDSLKCTIPLIRQIPILDTVKGPKSNGGIIYNLHWTAFPADPVGDYTIKGNVLLNCDSKNKKVDGGNRYSVNINFSVIKDAFKKLTLGCIKHNPHPSIPKSFPRTPQSPKYSTKECSFATTQVNYRAPLNPINWLMNGILN